MNKKIFIICALIFTTARIQSAQADEHSTIKADITRRLNNPKENRALLYALKTQDFRGIMGHDPDILFSLMSRMNARGMNPVQMYFNQEDIDYLPDNWDKPHMLLPHHLNSRIEWSHKWIASGEKLLATDELTDLGKAAISNKIRAERKIILALQLRKVYRKIAGKPLF